MSEFPATLQLFSLSAALKKDGKYGVTPYAERSAVDQRARLRRCADAITKGDSFRRLRWKGYSALEIAEARKMVAGK
jgi:hypothetical protein